ncbi:NAD(P)H-dependent oxidoreductase [Pseudomonas aeruginosa]|nr:NAD(P)H-dependent oxidoreductase [Pseudomonas aeruginosa]
MTKLRIRPERCGRQVTCARCALRQGWRSAATLFAAEGPGHLADLALEELDEVVRLVEADAIVFGSPTYMGGPAWQFKKFADATSKPWFVQLASLTPRAGYRVSTSRPTLACSLISGNPVRPLAALGPQPRASCRRRARSCISGRQLRMPSTML